MTGPQERDEPVEPFWMLAANVVLWRRYGEGGQGQRPGTKMFKGGSKVYVGTTHNGVQDCEVVGRPRHGRGYRWSYVATRHLYGFRPILVRSPAVLRVADGGSATRPTRGTSRCSWSAAPGSCAPAPGPTGRTRSPATATSA